MGNYGTQAINDLSQTASQQTPSQVVKNLSGSGGLLNGLSVGGIIVGIVLSFVGLAYLGYGKKNGRYSAIISGIGMMVFPYFVYNVVRLIVIGAVFLIIPFVINF